MSGSSSIEWTDATWNPTRGCRKISPGCKHCYAETFAERWIGVHGHVYELGFKPRLAPDKLDAPLHWKKPRRIFVNSMSDLFLEDFPDEYIATCFGVMAACPQHTFQVLTKRAERMTRWFGWANEGRIAQHMDRLELPANGMTYPRYPTTWPLSNVWIGVSVEDQRRADERIPRLLGVPAAVRFLSCEPLLGPLDLSAFMGGSYVALPGDHVEPNYNFGLHWVIVGGESGSGARPMDLAWARSIVEQCKAAGVACFVKQLGAQPWFAENDIPDKQCLSDRKGGDPAEWPADLRVREWPQP